MKRNKMLDYPQYMTEAHRKAVSKPAYYANGTERPASRKKVQQLVDKWTQTK